MAIHWVEIAIADYGFKCFISLCIFLPAYGVLLNRIQTLDSETGLAQLSK